MKIIMPDGQVVERAFIAADVTGYVARSVELDGKDALALLRIVESHPHDHVVAMLRQFAYRFESNRVQA